MDFWQTSGQDVGIDRHALPPHTTTKRNTTKSQNNETPRTIRKSNYQKSINQEFKEATIIQMGRRGGELRR